MSNADSCQQLAIMFVASASIEAGQVTAVSLPSAWMIAWCKSNRQMISDWHSQFVNVILPTNG